MNRIEERLREINLLLSLDLEQKDPITLRQLEKEKNDILKELHRHGDV